MSKCRMWQRFVFLSFYHEYQHMVHWAVCGVQWHAIPVDGQLCTHDEPLKARCHSWLFHEVIKVKQELEWWQNFQSVAKIWGFWLLNSFLLLMWQTHGIVWWHFFCFNFQWIFLVIPCTGSSFVCSSLNLKGWRLMVSQDCFCGEASLGAHANFSPFFFTK